ncbi:uncharacterized protein PHACADRAFT_194803 [Phanerochaete carnosa HHB-10118-sp]|uniref:VWFA domain-containing protein n=1 Tax=Phanerochaete carnosa (strain HHB-10118-sp) TaxID=650164 RepID=K5W079_PHACS|nr:uncharacterized protein PHACADRAFT_194803 [Phanerochaete carnosa HHB-10118-sp]EKM57238.1 hypothetical protein PHACADRAFT_194803 [Phanerochaete carnosa HHB-10118-sp]
MASQSFSGVVHASGDGNLTHLPLEEVKVNTLIVDVSTRVDVTQVFYNPSIQWTPRAKYVFPVPARAAVCAFDMGTSTGRVIVGVAKEKEQAKAEHETAIQEGRTTALVEWITSDIFSISLGSIGPRERVTTRLTYVMDLMDNDAATEVRFQVPMCIGQRYGEPPRGMVGASFASAQIRVRFDVHIQMRGEIRSVDSPSHPEIHAAAHQTHLGRPSRHRFLVRFRSPDFLKTDFVLVIKATDLDRPRCFAERDPTGSGSVAMQLTLVPKFDLPPVTRQEFIFVVDRSGSMSGSRVETAKRTLSTLLRTLPSAGTSFNIFSFGSYCNSLWQTSEVYTNDALDVATRHAASMDANYGGTEIGAALLRACNGRDPSRPTVMFVLTDGKAYDQMVYTVVANAVARSTAAAPLRVFTLGIGATASSAMCEGIARAGNGKCLMALASEDIVGKCATLMRAGRSFLLKNVSVDWGIPPDAARRFEDPKIETSFHQAPTGIRDLYPGVRLVVFALIKNAKFAIPKTITLHAQRDGVGEVLELPVPVEIVRFVDENGHRLIHTLAARRLITQLEDDALVSPTMSEDERKAAIVSLGETYQLASRYTSFVAVDDDGEKPPPIPRPAWAKAAFARREAEKARRAQRCLERRGFLDTLSEYVGTALTFGGLVVSEFFRTWFGRPAPPPPPQNPSAAQSELAQEEEQTAQDGKPRPQETDYDSDDTYSTMSSLISSSSWTETDDSRPPTPDPQARSPSPDLDLDPARQIPGAYASDEGPTGGPIDDSVQELLQLQTADGSFETTESLKRVIGEDVVENSRPPQVDERLWTTALAVAYCRKRLVGHQDLLGCIVEKALEYALRAGCGDMDFEALVASAARLVS